MDEILKRVEAIEERNKRVENDKKWEGSFLRKSILLVTTYLLIGIYMNLISVNNPWVNAVIPSLGFLISTLTLEWAKKLWLKSQNRR